MSDPFGKAAIEAANNTGKQHNNNELNIQTNSAETNEGALDSDRKGDDSWRDQGTSMQTGNSGSQPAKTDGEVYVDQVDDTEDNG